MDIFVAVFYIVLEYDWLLLNNPSLVLVLMLIDLAFVAHTHVQ